MTGKQRALAAIRGQATDRPSVLPSIDVAYAPECIGRRVGECFLNPKLHAQALMGALDTYPDIDGLYINLCLDGSRLTRQANGLWNDGHGLQWYVPENDVGTVKVHEMEELDDPRMEEESSLRFGILETFAAIKPEYTGDGTLVLEPTYKYILLEDLAHWNGSVVLDDGLFLACDSKLKQKAVMRSNLSSAVAGNEGLFNLGIVGEGVICLESPCPREELIEITLQDDVLKVDGNMAIAWSGSLDFTVERSGKTLVGSAASGEGLVNVYRGTGKVLLAPVLGVINV